MWAFDRVGVGKGSLGENSERQTKNEKRKTKKEN